MEPRISKRESKTLLRYASAVDILKALPRALTRINSYEIEHRIHTSSIYPVIAPNGSAVILYGHDRGLRILWRGGRRPRESGSRPGDPQPNGVTQSQDVIVIDDDGDESQRAQLHVDPEDDYESEEEEQDPDDPIPAIIQDVDIGLNAEVLRIALPPVSSPTTYDVAALTKTHMILALACSNGNAMLLTIPLAPPTSSTKEDFVNNDISEIVLESDGLVPNDLAIKVLPSPDRQLPHAPKRVETDAPNGENQVLLAVAAKSIKIWNISLMQDSLSKSEHEFELLARLPVSALHVSFHPVSRSAQILIVDQYSTTRIFEVPAAKASSLQFSSQGSVSSTPLGHRSKGRWVMSYQAPFQSEKETSAPARRKRILAAEWVLGGRGLLALLEGSEFGIWDLAGPSAAGKSVEDFALRGFLQSSVPVAIADAGKQKKAGSKLAAPMTPNTRKMKAERLFSGDPKPTAAAPTGSISIISSSNRSGNVDESIAVCYNDDVYSIPSMKAFWQRSTGGGGGTGSLYRPGLIHISDIDLMNESITSVSQFALPTTSDAFGTVKPHCDLLISAERRFIIVQHLRSHGSSGALFQPQIAERPASRDQRMLDAGDLDVAGMDRVLDDMAVDAPRTRRVAFAH